MADMITAFAVVFLAELGDKTQLVALTLAGRYPARKVLAALGGTILVLQTLSVTAGAVISDLVPGRAIAIGAGALFLAFAVWTWRSGDGDADDGVAASGGLVAVAVAFFLAELGDKTMLTTAGLAADRGAVAVWIGSIAAMLAATTLAVVGGRSLAGRVAPRHASSHRRGRLRGWWARSPWSAPRPADERPSAFSVLHGRAVERRHLAEDEAAASTTGRARHAPVPSPEAQTEIEHGFEPEVLEHRRRAGLGRAVAGDHEGQDLRAHGVWPRAAPRRRSRRRR